MYPRNAEFPEPFAIGSVIRQSDGEIETSGCSVKIKPKNGAAYIGTGTIAYEEGVVGYTPVQAETDYTSFQAIAYKAGCYPAAVTIITTATDISGTVVPTTSSVTAIAEEVRVELTDELTKITETATQESVDEIMERIRAQVPEGPVIVVPAITDPTQTVGWILCLDENGLPEAGVTITVQLTWRSAGLLGYAYDMTPVTATSGQDGFAYVILPRGADLQFIGRRDLGKRKYFYGSDADSFQLPALIGTA